MKIIKLLKNLETNSVPVLDEQIAQARF